MELDYDYVRVYDGTSTSATEIATYDAPSL